MSRVPRYLGLVVLLAMAGFAAAGFYAIRKGIDDLRTISQDNILWSTTQMEVELLRFQYSVARLAAEQSEAALAEVQERFDIFWSRMSLIQSGRVGALMRSYDVELGSVAAIQAYLEEVDPVIATLEPDDTATLARILEEVERFRHGLRLYTLGVVRGDTAMTATVRESIQRNAQIAGAISLVALLVSVLSLGLIMRENHRQREAADASRRRAEQAALANRAKSRFLSMMSHEMRNPLNGVIGPLALLHQSDIAPRHRTLVTRAQNCGQSMLQMLGGLLDYAEIQDGRFRLDIRPFRLRALAAAVRETLAGQGAEAVDVELRPGVPDRAQGDLDRFRQIFVHLTDYVLESVDARAVQIVFDHDGERLTGEIRFTAEGPAIDWKLDLLMGLSEVAPDQVSSDALRPLVARGLIAAGEGVLSLTDRADGKRAIRVSLPAEPVRLERIRLYLETRSAALKTIYQAALKSDRVVFADPDTVDPVDVVLIDSTTVGEDALMARLRARFRGALFVSLGLPQAPDFFDDVLEMPNDMALLRTSVLGRLASQ